MTIDSVVGAQYINVTDTHTQPRRYNNCHANALHWTAITLSAGHISGNRFHLVLSLSTSVVAYNPNFVLELLAPPGTCPQRFSTMVFSQRGGA